MTYNRLVAHSDTRRVLTVFLASPGDLQEERKIARDVVEHVNQLIGRRVGWQIDLLGWEETLPGCSRPQEIINVDVHRSDLFVGLLWKRWGMPPGTDFTSGFEEEYELAIQKRMDTDCPEIWLFFKQIDDSDLQDPGEQLTKAIAFRKRIVEERRLLYREFAGAEDWRKIFFNSLTAHLLSLNSQVAPEPSPNAAQLQTAPAEKPGRAVSTGRSDADRQSAIEQIAHVLSLFSRGWLTNEARSFALDADIDRFAVARLGLFSACWLSYTTSAEVLGIHDANMLYCNREKIKPLMGERLTLLRSTITKPQTLPGWVWVGNFSEEEIVKNLRVFAAYDRNATVRKRALSLLTDLKIPLEVGVIEDLNFGETVIADSDTDVVEAACDYLGAVGTEELFPLLDSIDQPEAQIAHLRILMRVRPDEAVHDVIELPESTGKIRAAVEEQMGTLRKESVRILLSSANSAIRCMALNELSTRGALAEAEARSALDDQNVEVRRSALDVLIRQAASGIDTKMIREKGRADMPTFFQAWTGPDEEDLILSLFRKVGYPLDSGDPKM